MKTPRKTIASAVVAGALLAASAVHANRAPSPAGTGDAILGALKTELDRSMAALSKGDPPVYFISYVLADRQYASRAGIEWRVAFEQR